MKVSRIQRLLRLIMRLQSGRKPDANTLAQDLGVSRRTVFRDLKLLDKAGVPYEFDHQTRGYGLGEGSLLRPLNLAVEEAMALLMLTRKFLVRAPLPDRDAAMRAALKIEGLLPGPVQQHVGPLLDGLVVREGPASSSLQDTSLFSTVQAAVSRRAKLRLTYDALRDGTLIDTTVSPYRVVFINHAWHLIGFSGYHDGPHTFKLERITKCSKLSGRFNEPVDFDLDSYFGKAWQMNPRNEEYLVRIRFSTRVARTVREVRWHKTQRMRVDKDRTLVFEATVAGLDEIVWWVLGYGDEAVVEEPAELRHMIHDRARKMIRHYSRNGHSGGA